MPIYEYECKSCGTVIEVIQRVGDRRLRKCRACSGRLEKLVSLSSFQLKGGGWYSEGYHKTGGSKPASKASGSTKTSSKGSSSGSSSSGSSASAG